MLQKMAEREGFEPSKRLPVYTLSRRAPSTITSPVIKLRKFVSLQLKIPIPLQIFVFFKPKDKYLSARYAYKRCWS